MKSVELAGPRRSAADPVASLTIVAVAVACLVAAWFLPWWMMEARAPQYGQRVLVVQVSPTGVSGDVFEVDTLGHYVGIAKMETFGQLERKLGPIGLLAAIVGMLIAPFLRRRWLRLVAVLPALVLPVAFLADLDVTMRAAANDRDPEAALNLILGEVETRLFGEYAVAQFKIHAKTASGIFMAGAAALLGLGLAFSRPLARRAEAARHRVGAVAAGATILLAALSADAAEHRVRSGERIADAVAEAADGDTIVVAAGVYRERILIDRRVRLIGEPGAVIDGGGEGTVVRVAAPGSELRGLVIRGSGAGYGKEDAGVRIQDVAGVRLVDLRIEDVLFGVFVAAGDRTQIEDTTIVGKDLPHTRRGDGIRLWYSKDCTIRGNRIEQSRDLVIWYSQGTTVEDNIVVRSRYGLHYMYSDENQLGAAPPRGLRYGPQMPFLATRAARRNNGGHRFVGVVLKVVPLLLLCLVEGPVLVEVSA